MRYRNARDLVGDLKWSIMTLDHEGWVMCDGRSVSRQKYKALFDVIGTSFGSESASTFNLPDCRGRVVGTVGQGVGLTNRAMGARVGAETHTLTTSEMPSHSHNVTDPGHTHAYTNNTNDQGLNNTITTESAADNADLSQTTGSSTTGITIQNNGGGQAHNNMQPTIFIGNVFILSTKSNRF